MQREVHWERKADTQPIPASSIVLSLTLKKANFIKGTL